MSGKDIAWHPRSAHIHASGVARLIQALGVATYDELLALALAEPGPYWSTVAKLCEWVWDVPPSAYVDVTRGAAFPRWFPGARLNWVNTVLTHGERSETRDAWAVIVENEAGDTQRLTYAELGPEVRAAMAGLSALGIGQGDRIGLYMENGREATVALLAIAGLGAIAVPLFSGFGVDAVVARLAAAEARLLVASRGFLRRGREVRLDCIVNEARAALPRLERVIWTTPSAMQGSDDQDWSTLLTRGSGTQFTPPSLSPDDPFLLIYTSGTTGKPKGIVHTHGGFPLKIAHDALVHFNLAPGSVFCWPADLGWIAGTLVLSSALLRGATLVCYTGAPDMPDHARMARLIERHRVTHYGAAPTLIRSFASQGTAALAADLSSLELLITAGEGIAPEHFCWFADHFGRGELPLINYTGGTEVSGALLASVVVRPIVPSAFNSASPGVAVDVIDADGRTLIDTVGELAVRAPFIGMTQSFWQDDERYLDTYWRSVNDVWVHGDLAQRRSDGQFFLRGRSDDTLKIAGKRLGPAEVEETVMKIAGIVDAAAVGIADSERGERLVMFVVGDAQAAARVAETVEGGLGKPFRPSAVHRLTQLPKTRSGKTLRRLLRNVYAGLPPGDLSSLDNPASLDEVRELAAPFDI